MGTHGLSMKVFSALLCTIVSLPHHRQPWSLLLPDLIFALSVFFTIVSPLLFSCGVCSTSLHVVVWVIYTDGSVI